MTSPQLTSCLTVKSFSFWITNNKTMPTFTTFIEHSIETPSQSNLTQHLLRVLPSFRSCQPHCVWLWQGNFKLPHRTGHPYTNMKIKCSENLNIKKMQAHMCMRNPSAFLKNMNILFHKATVLISFP